MNTSTPQPHTTQRRIVLTRPGRSARKAALTMNDLPQLLEAHALIERIGWELARKLANRIGP